MTSLTNIFKKGPVLVPYITAGDPNFEITAMAIETLSKNGAGIIEVGIPFSDSAADGEINQRSFGRSLKNGFRFNELFKTLRKIREKNIDTPLILFGHMNPFFQYGLEKLAKEAKEIGVRGLLIVDLPFESAGEIEKLFAEYDLSLIYLIGPTTTQERMREIASRAKGFLYCIARVGVTGKQTTIDEGLIEYINSIKKVTKLPLAVGFGISNGEQVKKLAPYTEGIVVGSALVSLFEEYGNDEERLRQEIENFIKGLKSCL